MTLPGEAWGVGVSLHSFLTSALDGDGQSALHRGWLNREGIIPSTHWVPYSQSGRWALRKMSSPTKGTGTKTRCLGFMQGVAHWKYWLRYPVFLSWAGLIQPTPCHPVALKNVTVAVRPYFSKWYFDILRTNCLEHFIFSLLAASSVIVMLIDLFTQVTLHAVDFDSNVLFICWHCPYHP